MYGDRNVLGTRFYTRLYFKKGAKLAFYVQKEEESGIVTKTEMSVCS